MVTSLVPGWESPVIPLNLDDTSLHSTSHIPASCSPGNPASRSKMLAILSPTETRLPGCQTTQPPPIKDRHPPPPPPKHLTNRTTPTITATTPAPSPSNSASKSTPTSSPSTPSPPPPFPQTTPPLPPAPTSPPPSSPSPSSPRGPPPPFAPSATSPPPSSSPPANSTSNPASSRFKPTSFPLSRGSRLACRLRGRCWRGGWRGRGGVRVVRVEVGLGELEGEGKGVWEGVCGREYGWGGGGRGLRLGLDVGEGIGGREWGWVEGMRVVEVEVAGPGGERVGVEWCREVEGRVNQGRGEEGVTPLGKARALRGWGRVGGGLTWGRVELSEMSIAASCEKRY